MPKIIKNNMGEPADTRKEHSEIVWARIDSVVTLILENTRYMHAKRSGELTEIVMKNFGLQMRQAKYYVSEAKREIRRIGIADKKKAFVRAIQDREFLLQKAKGTKKENKIIEKPDYKLALEIVKDRDKLFGLYVDETKTTGEVTIKNIDLSKFTEHGLERLKRGDKIEEVLMDPKAVKAE